MKMKRQKKNCYRLLMMLAVVFFALDVSAQATISGHVKDETGEGVIGASVMVKGTSNGTVTDFDGNFSLQCQSGATLVFSYIGYNPQEQPAKNGMEVTMKEDVGWVMAQWPRKRFRALWYRSARISSTREPPRTPWRW